MQRLPVLLALALGVVLAALLAASCASGGAAVPAPSAADDGSPEKGSGIVSVSLRWPERSKDVEARLVPVASESVRIRATDPATGEDVGASPLVLTRPAPGESLVSTGAITDLPLGDVEFEASAHPDEAGEGLPVQACATVVREIVEGHNTDLPLTMASTITQVQVALDPTSAFVGESGTAIAVAKNAADEIVLTGDTWAWSSSDPLTATVTPSADGSCTVEAVADGSAGIVARETESGVSGSASLAVAKEGKVAWHGNGEGNEEVYVASWSGEGLINVSNDPALDSSPCLSADNSKVAWVSGRDGNLEIYVANTDGTGAVNVSNHAGLDQYPSISADGSKVAWESWRDGNQEIYVANSDGSGITCVSNDAGVDERPSISGDGTKIAWTGGPTHNRYVYVANVDGTGRVNVSESANGDTYYPSLSGDGSVVAWQSQTDIYTANTDGTNVRNITNSTLDESGPSLSADGSILAWRCDDGVQSEILVGRADGADQVNVSNSATSDDINPCISADGARVVWSSDRDGDRDIYIANVDGTGLVQVLDLDGRDLGPSLQGN